MNIARNTPIVTKPGWTTPVVLGRPTMFRLQSLNVVLRPGINLRPKETGILIVPSGERDFKSIYQDKDNPQTFYYVQDFTISMVNNKPCLNFSYFGFSKGLLDKGADIEVDFETKKPLSADQEFKKINVPGATLKQAPLKSLAIFLCFDTQIDVGGQRKIQPKQMPITDIEDLGDGKFKAKFPASETGAKEIFNAISNKPNTIIKLIIEFDGVEIVSGKYQFGEGHLPPFGTTPKLQKVYKTERRFGVYYPCDKFPDLYYDKDTQRARCPDFEPVSSKRLQLVDIGDFRFLKNPYSNNEYYYLPVTYKLYRHEDHLPVLSFIQLENEKVLLSFQTIPYVDKESIKKAQKHVRDTDNVANPVFLPLTQLQSAKLTFLSAPSDSRDIDLFGGFYCELVLSWEQYLVTLQKLRSEARTGIGGNIVVDIDDSLKNIRIGFNLHLDDLIGEVCEIKDLKRGPNNQGWQFMVSNIIESPIKVINFEVDFYTPPIDAGVTLMESSKVPAKLLPTFADASNCEIQPSQSAIFYVQPDEPKEKFEPLIYANHDVMTDTIKLLEKLVSRTDFKFKFAISVDTPSDAFSQDGPESLDIQLKYKSTQGQCRLTKNELKKDIIFELPISQAVAYDPERASYEVKVVAYYPIEKGGKKEGSWRPRTGGYCTVYPQEAES